MAKKDSADARRTPSNAPQGMQYVKLGNSGLDVSRICLGCMGFGDAKNGFKWALDEKSSAKAIHAAYDMGINFFDTANCYSFGSSEEYVGKAIKKLPREEIVVATKVFWPMRFSGQAEGGKRTIAPNGGGLSRKEIIHECEQSLKRLGLDWIDLYIIHRWDYGTPIEETMSALDSLVKSGKVRYLGASAMHAWQFQKAQFAAERNGWTKFISMQNHFNLLYREEEREMLPLCRDLGVACTPYSPLASGRLSRPWGEKTKRSASDEAAQNKYGPAEALDRPVVERLAGLAQKRGLPMAQIALAWLLGKSPVAAPIVGASKQKHLQDAVAALSVSLSPKECAYLEAPYQPHRIVGTL
jgi:aryl-alcohol dehydrogenase-like predicted oxidoreductase